MEDNPQIMAGNPGLRYLATSLRYAVVARG